MAHFFDILIKFIIHKQLIIKFHGYSKMLNIFSISFSQHLTTIFKIQQRKNWKIMLINRFANKRKLC